MVHLGPAVYAAIVAVAITPVFTACSGTDSTAAAPSSATSSAPTSATSASTSFPELPAYNVAVIGNEIHVATSTANPVDLLHIYSKVAETMRGRLPKGGYRVQINCYSLDPDKWEKRLANGHIDVGELGTAPNGDLGGFYEVVPGADCP
ncbi:hypothetical protein [Nocardia sp. NBC_01009]|uniref:hypothetical protein n=1 Tax=Nocardia sp. NBC_01009 TaxID=2975996 RepID=UPI0038675E44|nr:hypothetical protein OHA42_24070 [Nocardia sp. NBC_01009]